MPGGKRRRRAEVCERATINFLTDIWKTIVLISEKECRTYSGTVQLACRDYSERYEAREAVEQHEVK